jgi:hypothetical protein
VQPPTRRAEHHWRRSQSLNAEVVSLAQTLKRVMVAQVKVNGDVPGPVVGRLVVRARLAGHVQRRLPEPVVGHQAEMIRERRQELRHAIALDRIAVGPAHLPAVALADEPVAVSPDNVRLKVDNPATLDDRLHLELCPAALVCLDHRARRGADPNTPHPPLHPFHC